MITSGISPPVQKFEIFLLLAVQAFTAKIDFSKFVFAFSCAMFWQACDEDASSSQAIFVSAWQFGRCLDRSNGIRQAAARTLPGHKPFRSPNLSKKNRTPWPKPASIPANVHTVPEASAPLTKSEAPAIAPISPAQLAANRANAQLSTGPRTAAGLARSSQNAVKSALTGRTVLLPTDDVEEYARFLAGFQNDFKPSGQVECELVQVIVDCFWRQRRIQALEFALYAHGHEQFEDAFNDLPEAHRYNRIVLQTHMTYEKQFRNFQIQEARLDRKRAKAMAELERLQAERKANEQPSVNGNRGLASGQVLGQQSRDCQSSEPALPGHLGNGFVFSNDETVGKEVSVGLVA